MKMLMSIPVGDQKELLGSLSKSGRQGRILLDRSVGDHSVPAAPAITPTILQVELNYLSLLRYESSTLILYKELSSTIFQSCLSVRHR